MGSLQVSTSIYLIIDEILMPTSYTQSRHQSQSASAICQYSTHYWSWWVALSLSLWTRSCRQLDLVVSFLLSHSLSATGTSLGYFSSRSNLQEGMDHLQEHQRIVNASKSGSQEGMNKLDLKAGQQLHHEGGVSGMYDYQDRSHSTRGDH